jgi:uncharacterized membrane protein
MRIYRQANPSENAVIVLKNLLQKLNITLPDQSYKELSSRTDYPSLSSITDFLNDIDIESLGVSLKTEQLREIPYPAIAHMKGNSDYFILLEKIIDNRIFYINTKSGQMSESLTDFESKWSGVILLIQANELHSKKYYTQSIKEETFQSASLLLSLLMSIVIFVLPILTIPLTGIGNYLLSGVGMAVSFLLLQKQFGLSSSTLNSFCKLGSKSDCDPVINSPASKLFGIVNLSEVGLWYFTGSVLSIALATIASTSVDSFLFVSTLFAAALSFPAIYYQGLVIKKWCPLCLAVAAVIWIQAAFYMVTLPAVVFDFKSASVLFIGFFLPLIFWLSIRKQFIYSLNVPNLQRNLNRFLKSERIFQKLLEDQPDMEMGQFTHELNSGMPDAPIQLVVVSNPQCGPCAYTHSILENLKDALNEKVNIVYRFTANTSDKSTVSYQMLESLFSRPLKTLMGLRLKE